MIRAAAVAGDSGVRVNILPRSPRTSVHSLPFARSWAPPGDHFLCELGLPAEYSPLGRIAVYQCLKQPIEHERASTHKKGLSPRASTAFYKYDTCFIMCCFRMWTVHGILYWFQTARNTLLFIMSVWCQFCLNSTLSHMLQLNISIFNIFSQSKVFEQ